MSKYYQTIFLLLNLFGAFPFAPQSDAPSQIRGYDQIVARHKTFESFLKLGAERAEEFRHSYIESGINESKAETLGRLIHSFTQQKLPALDDVADELMKPNLDKLHELFLGLELADNGTRVAESVYGPFAGKWFGRWTDFEVDHHWSKVVSCEPTIPFTPNVASKSRHFIQAYQYAWIGDGYGINYLTREERKTESTEEIRYHLLGYVEHIKNGNFDQITARRPHVAIQLKHPGSICWITEREVFFEQASNVVGGKADRYSIRGFYYSTDESSMNSSSGFYTRYSRRPSNRFSFRKFALKINTTRQ